jgi:hypothetical protein
MKHGSLCARCTTRPRDSVVYFANRQHPWCNACRADYMRDWRKRNPLTPEQRKKDIARSYAGVYFRRGKIKRTPCKVCGDPNSQMHHPDYSKPLAVEWLCKRCHLAEHRNEATGA